MNHAKFDLFSFQHIVFVKNGKLLLVNIYHR
jgi:hypothetical protein